MWEAMPALSLTHCTVKAVRVWYGRLCRRKPLVFFVACRDPPFSFFFVTLVCCCGLASGGTHVYVLRCFLFASSCVPHVSFLLAIERTERIMSPALFFVHVVFVCVSCVCVCMSCLVSVCRVLYVYFCMCVSVCVCAWVDASGWGRRDSVHMCVFVCVSGSV